jgi:hypothetical protein
MAQIRYISADEARITQRDHIWVDVEFFGDPVVLTALEPRRLFPVSGLEQYISLLDAEGVERAIVRDIKRLMPESQEALQNALREYYMIPKIRRFIKISENSHVWMWTVDTDRGNFTFEVRNGISSIKKLYDGRVIILDASDNRYEIPDVDALDKKSRHIMLPNL